MTDPIVKTIEVACSPALAFDVFTRRIRTWWPLDSKSASASSGKAAQDLTIDPHVGGVVCEVKHDGSKDIWGEVLAYDDPHLFAMTWHPGTNEGHPTEVRVEFEAAGPDRCKVTLTHKGWEIWAEKAAEMRENYNGGWAGLLDQFYSNACAEAA